MSTQRSEILSVSLPKEIAQKVRAVSKRDSLTQSELLRTALRTYFDMREFTDLQRDAATRARAAGIRTEQAVEDAVDAVREQESN